MSIGRTLKIEIMKNVLALGLELKNDLREKGLSIDDNFVVKVFSNNIEFILDEDGKRVFGGEVNVTGYAQYEGDRDIKINKGSLGAIDNNCVASVATINLMCMALNNWEEFAESCEFAMDTMERRLSLINGDI